MVKKDLTNAIISLAICVGLVVGFSIPLLGLPPLGSLFFPGNGIWEIPVEVDNSEIISDPSLEDEVTIYRDNFGVPHIYASSEVDAMFALGICHGQDRLFMMEMARRLTRGQMSAIMGESMIDSDKYNLAMLKDYYSVATYEALVEGAESDPELATVLLLLQRYTAGVNSYIDNAKTLPLEFNLLGISMEHWTIVDTISMGKYMAEDLTWSLEDLYNYVVYEKIGIDAYNYFRENPRPYQIPICPNYGEYLDNVSYPHLQYNFTELNTLHSASVTPSDQSQEMSPDENLASQFASLYHTLSSFPQEKQRQELGPILGSNNWVIDGNLSASGYPMICNDMHLGWSLPGIWYQAHIIISDEENPLNLWGFFLPGVPYPLVGQNDYLGWGFTNTYYDVLDIYYYTAINDTHYIQDGEIKAFSYINYNIEVLGAPSESYTIKVTDEGPVFSDFISDSSVGEALENSIIAIQWLAMNVTWELQAFYRYAHATNRTEFNEGSKKFWLPSQNHVYADIYGNIAIRPTGKVPVRDDSLLSHPNLGNGNFPYNGSAGEGKWIGWVPFEDLPNDINPDQHYLASANQIVAGPEYLENYSLQTTYSSGYRARRINNLLQAKAEFSQKDMQDIQLDTYSEKAANVLPILLDFVENQTSLTTLEQTVLEKLNSWDFQMDQAKAEPTIFKLWFEMLRDAIFLDEFEFWDIQEYIGFISDAHIEYLLKMKMASWFDDISTPQIEPMSLVLYTTFSRALEELQVYFDDSEPDTWIWGDLHQNYFDHLTGIPALSLGPYPANGTADTVNPSYGNIWQNGVVKPAISRGGASERWICDFGNLDESISVIPSGQRGIAGSKFYSDQLELFLEGKYHPNYYTYTLPSNFDQNQLSSILIIKPEGSA